MTRKSIKLTLLSLLTVTLIGTSVFSLKADEASDIKYRQTVMKAIGGTMGGMGAIVKGKAPRGNADALSHAMWQLSKVTKNLFPTGSDFGETRAKEDIWKKPSEFKAAVMAFESAAKELSHVVHSGDSAAFAAAFKALGKSCGGCHKPFRKSKS